MKYYFNFVSFQGADTRNEGMGKRFYYQKCVVLLNIKNKHSVMNLVGKEQSAQAYVLISPCQTKTVSL